MYLGGSSSHQFETVTCSEHIVGVPGRGLGVAVRLSHLRLLQGCRVLDEEHQAADQHLSIDGLRLHLESVHKEVDNPRLEVVEVGEGDAPVCPWHELLDGHVGKLQRQAQQ